MRRLPRGVELLVWLYPPSHRREYGREMLHVTRHRLAEAGGGPRATAAAAFDLAWGALGVWKDRAGRRMMGLGRGLGLDARFVVRSLWKSRGYVATATAVLACAVAVNATVFSYVRGTLLDEAPYPEPERVMVVWGSNTVDGQLRDVISGPNYIDIQEGATSLRPVAAFHSDAAYLMVDGRPEVVDALEVTAGFLDVLGVEPAMGRFFDERERTSGGAETVVVTHAFWTDALGADPDVLGRRLDFEGEPKTVVGVLPEGLEFISPAPLFIPIHDDVLAADERSHIHYHMLGRLATGATVADANRELEPIMDEIAAEYRGYEGWRFLVEPLHTVSVEAVRPVILILTATVTLVLLVALVNLATLFRIRALAREGELAVRAALGAGRLPLVRVLALESLGIATVGASLGLMAAPFVLALVSDRLPVWIAIPESAARVPALHAVLDPSVAFAAFGAAFLGALLLTAPGLAAALRGIDARRPSGDRVRSGMRSTRVLVGVELVVATVLCIGAALTARSAANLLSEEVGVDAEGLLTMYVGDVWDGDPRTQVQYFRDVVEQVERIPGIDRAGVIDYVDFQAEDDFERIYFLDREGEAVYDIREEWRRVDEGLFDAAGMQMLNGRGFEAADFIGAPRVGVVNRSFAAKHYPERSPVGEYISTGNTAYRSLEIVGVVADVRSRGPATPPPAMLYVPNQGAPRGTQSLYVRVAGNPMSFATTVRKAVWSVDSHQPIAEITPMADLVDGWLAIPRATRSFVTGLAALAWLLSALGVFGVVAYTVRTRRAELGIRLALGATPDRLEVDQLRGISPVVVLGVGMGAALGVLAARAADSILYGVGPADPTSVVLAVTAMILATLVATWLPARRAGRVDPTEVIRAE